MQSPLTVQTQQLRWLPFAVGILIAGATLWLWQGIIKEGEDRSTKIIELQTLSASHELAEQLKLQMLPLMRMAHEWEDGEPPTQKEWKSDAEIYLELYPFYRSIKWVSLDRAVTWSSEREGFSAISESKIRPIIDAVKYQKEPWTSRAFDIDQESDRKGIIACVTVYRVNEPAGYLLGEIDVHGFLDSLITRSVGNSYSVAVFENDQEIYNNDTTGGMHRKTWSQTRSFSPFNKQTWKVEVWPKTGALTREQSYFPNAILIGGLSAAVLLTLVSYFAQSSRLHAARLKFINQKLNYEIEGREQSEEELRKTKNELEIRVQERTAALSTANQDLQQEVLERKKAEGAVRESEIKFRSVAHSANDAIVSTDTEGKIIFWNHGAQKMFGYSEEEVLQQSLNLILSTEAFKDKDLKTFLTLDGDDSHKKIDLKGKNKDGSEFPMECSLANWKTGTQTYFTAVFHDITEHERVKEMLGQVADSAIEASRLKAEFLANVSHEIRTPMNGILGMTALLLQSELSTRQREFADSVKTCADDLLTLINDILDFSKIEAGKLRFEKVSFDLSTVVEGAVDFLAERAHTKGIELSLFIAQDIHQEVSGDPGRLRQVLMNLIGNALKFTEEGEVQVRVEKEQENENRTILRFSVRDTGIGIPQELQEDLFQPFVQADSSTSRKYGGTGLGLAISKQLVNGLGGQIGIESKPKDGSTFWFSLPFDKQPTIPKSASPKKGRESMRALVVDDHESVRRIIQEYFKSEEIVCDAASDATSALQLMKSEAAAGKPYTVAILDLEMPKIDGMDLARQIKSDTTLNSTRLMLMTAINFQDNTDEMSQMGIEASLTKPVKRGALFECLIQVLTLNFDPKKGTFRPRRGLSDSKIYFSKAIADINQDAAVVRKKPFKILVAEDNSVNQTVALRQLNDLGYNADAVANGQEVLDALAKSPYDLILMDCQMPAMDGYDATSEIRKLEGTSRHTIIVALTAHALDADKERCLQVGMDDYISKPFDPKDLSAILEKWLENKTNGNGANGKTPEPKPSQESKTPPPGMAPSIDFKRLKLAAGDNPQSVDELLELFINQTSSELEQLKIAIASNKTEDGAQIAHKCAGSSETCGMMRLGKLFREMIKLCKEQNTAEFASAQKNIEEEFERIKIYTQSPEKLSS
jgi:PAS domain S-box-containing protein